MTAVYHCPEAHSQSEKRQQKNEALILIRENFSVCFGKITKSNATRLSIE
jgi:hypothetical protein